MDPDDTLRQMAEATADGDWARLKELAEAMEHWTETGGFQPSMRLSVEPIPDVKVTIPNVKAPNYDDGWVY